MPNRSEVNKIILNKLDKQFPPEFTYRKRLVAEKIESELKKKIMELPTHREIGWIGIEQADILKLFGGEDED